MTYTANDLRGRRLEATDGLVGKVKDVFFDDESWNIRYLVVDTGTWLDSREVLISPVSITGWDVEEDAITTSLSRSQVEHCPPATTDAPVSRLYEEQLHNHYGWPYYWGGTAFGGPGLYMYPPVGDVGLYPAMYGRTRDTELEQEERQALEARLSAANPHLKSCRDVRNYDIHATDGAIGHVEDFILDHMAGRITHLIVDTHNWLPAHKVAIRTDDVDHIDWVEAEVMVRLAKDQVKNAAPEDVVLAGADVQKPAIDGIAGSEQLGY
jgi:uncharacterized protein YrrD